MAPTALLTLLSLTLCPFVSRTAQGYIIGTVNSTQPGALGSGVPLGAVLSEAKTAPATGRDPAGQLLYLDSLLRGSTTPQVTVLGGTFTTSTTSPGGGPVVGAGSVVGASQTLSGGPHVGGSVGSVPYTGGRYSSSRVIRVDALFTPTVTQFVTIDRCVTVTDQAFNSVAVTLTALNLQTVTVGTRAVLQTPVDDRIAIQTTLVYRPTSLTVTCVKSDFRFITETSLDRITLTHTSYVIVQSTSTTTATQVITLTTTLVRTNINTQRTTLTAYRTLTDTVYVNSAYGSRAQ